MDTSEEMQAFELKLKLFQASADAVKDLVGLELWHQTLEKDIDYVGEFIMSHVDRSEVEYWLNVNGDKKRMIQFLDEFGDGYYE